MLLSKFTFPCFSLDFDLKPALSYMSGVIVPLKILSHLSNFQTLTFTSNSSLSNGIWRTLNETRRMDAVYIEFSGSTVVTRGVCYFGHMSLGPDQSAKTPMSLVPNVRRLNFWRSGE